MFDLLDRTYNQIAEAEFVHQLEQKQKEIIERNNIARYEAERTGVYKPHVSPISLFAANKYYPNSLFSLIEDFYDWVDKELSQIFYHAAHYCHTCGHLVSKGRDYTKEEITRKRSRTPQGICLEYVPTTIILNMSKN